METHESNSQSKELDGGTNRSFGWVFCLVFVAIAFYPLVDGGEYRLWAALVAIGFAGTAALRPQLLGPANRIWMRFGRFLSRIVNPIVLGIVFYAIVTPTGIVMRAMGKDLLRSRFESKISSYWISRDPAGPTPESMKNQF